MTGLRERQAARLHQVAGSDALPAACGWAEATGSVRSVSTVVSRAGPQDTRHAACTEARRDIRVGRRMCVGW